jgi:hypothetical protein
MFPLQRRTTPRGPIGGVRFAASSAGGGAMRDWAEGCLGGLVAVLINVVLIGGTSLGVVKEHCADLEQARAGVRDVDSGWTYILWPPLTLANLDPSGGCVRNSPLREGLAAIGLWELPSADEQVERHIREQLRDAP